MNNTSENNKLQGKAKTGVGKMWAYFIIWVAFITLGIFFMANSDSSSVEKTADKKVEKKEVAKKTTQSDERLAKN